MIHTNTNTKTIQELTNMASSYQSSPRAPNYNLHNHSTSSSNNTTTNAATTTTVTASAGTTAKSFQQAQQQKVHANCHNIKQNQEVVVVVVPFPAQGHLNQLLHLSRLILSYNIPVHFVGTPTHNRQAMTRVQGWDPKTISNIHIHDFNIPPFPSPSPNPNDPQTSFPSHLLPSFEASFDLREPVASLLRSLSSGSRRVVVIHDSLMAYVVQDAIKIPNCESYTFHSVSAFTMFLYFWDVMGRPIVENSHIPQVPSLEGCFTKKFLEFIASQYKFHKFSNGTIYNTTRAIEGPYMELIERMVSNKTHWALGPFNPLSMENKKSHPCMNWLDKQERNSVIYVSFGTTTAFTEEQIKELAIGLDQSNQKFIWVLRDADKGDIFNGEESKKVISLPKGFEEKMKNRGIGMIIRDWAPQLEILGHDSVGGFMSHCGWNSCMESITMGVPIAAWPMHSDQPRNRVLVTEILKVGVVVRNWENRGGIVKAECVESAVRRLMDTKEGDEMRERAINLKVVIRNSRGEGGVSREEMESFIDHITR